MVNTHFKIRHRSTAWWMAIIAPVMGVPIIVALLALAATVPEPAPLPPEESPAPEAVVEFVKIGGNEPLPCLERAPHDFSSGSDDHMPRGNDRLLLPT